MATIKFFEDYHVGDEASVGEFELEKKEMIEFAGKWDPQPFHTDETAAAESIYGGLTASGCHVVAIAMSLVEKSDAKPKVIGALGWDELRFPNPARPGDRLTLTLECIEARPSKSKSDRGIVRNQFTLSNQNGETVLLLKDTILVEKRLKQKNESKWYHRSRQCLNRERIFSCSFVIPGLTRNQVFFKALQAGSTFPNFNALSKIRNGTFLINYSTIFLFD